MPKPPLLWKKTRRNKLITLLLRPQPQPLQLSLPRDSVRRKRLDSWSSWSSNSKLNFKKLRDSRESKMKSVSARDTQLRQRLLSLQLTTPGTELRRSRKRDRERPKNRRSKGAKMLRGLRKRGTWLRRLPQLPFWLRDSKMRLSARDSRRRSA